MMFNKIGKKPILINLGSGDFEYTPSSGKNGDDADNLFKSSEDEVEQTNSERSRRNVFISFDMDDQNQVNFLRSQAKDERFPLDFIDYSVKEPFEDKWKSKVKDKIKKTTALIVMIGPNTHESKAVNWEIGEAHRQGKKVIGVRIYRNENHKIPEALKYYNYPITKWNTKTIGIMLE